MSKLRLAIIFGGESSEYPVSLHSVESVLHSVDKDKYDLFLVGIDQGGNWYHYNGSVEAIGNDTWKQGDVSETTLSCSKKDHGFLVKSNDGTYRVERVDCIFPVLHGKNGEDGTIQGVFELSGIPYVGCDVLSSSLVMDKEITHIIAEAAGITCAPYLAVYEYEHKPYNVVFEEAKEKLGLPFYIKPCNAGSSFGVHKVSDASTFDAALMDAFSHDGRGKVIIETAIEGFELGVAVMGDATLTIGSVDEIALETDFFDYEAKYDMKDAQIICPARIDEDTFKRAQEVARNAYRALNCKGMSRMDMFVTPNKELVFNEANTIPGFTATSRYPSMMKEIGYTFPKLIDALVEIALERVK